MMYVREMKRLKEYFDTVDKDTLYQDLVDCGLNTYSKLEEDDKALKLFKEEYL